MQKFSPMQLVRSLRSTLCPGCGGQKKIAQTLCRSCYASLSKDLKQRLYNRIGEGYELAFSDAMLSLDQTDPVMPADPATRNPKLETGN